jgi:hypothetical protein
MRLRHRPPPDLRAEPLFSHPGQAYFKRRCWMRFSKWPDSIRSASTRPRRTPGVAPQHGQARSSAQFVNVRGDREILEVGEIAPA